MPRIVVEADWTSEYHITPYVHVEDHADDEAPWWTPRCKAEGCGWGGEDYGAASLDDATDYASRHLTVDHPAPVLVPDRIGDDCPF